MELINGMVIRSMSELESKIAKKKLFFLIKRIGDILLTGIGMVFLLPFFLLFALLIYIDSPGPVLFKQIRVGKNGKEFYMYKLRSMCMDAEAKLEALLQQNEIEGAMFKMKDDPRVTKIGKLIRKTSIDEFPQLWNVFKGDMSLIGPRPPLPREVAEYTEHDKQRLLVTPGCTGLWQVSGRNNVSFHRMVELDLEYIEKASVFKDIKIMLKTIGVLFGAEDAF